MLNRLKVRILHLENSLILLFLQPSPQPFYLSIFSKQINIVLSGNNP